MKLAEPWAKPQTHSLKVLAVRLFSFNGSAAEWLLCRHGGALWPVLGTRVRSSGPVPLCAALGLVVVSISPRKLFCELVVDGGMHPISERCTRSDRV